MMFEFTFSVTALAFGVAALWGALRVARKLRVENERLKALLEVTRDEFARDSHVDMLTGLPNRQAF
jgi:PleD family two-component response regulator